MRGGSSTSGPGIVAEPVLKLGRDGPAFGAVAAPLLEADAEIAKLLLEGDLRAIVSDQALPVEKGAGRGWRRTARQVGQSASCEERPYRPRIGCRQPGGRIPAVAVFARSDHESQQAGEVERRLGALAGRGAPGEQGDAARAEVTSPVGEGPWIVFHFDRPRHDRGPAAVRVHVAFSNDAIPQMLSHVAGASH